VTDQHFDSQMQRTDLYADTCVTSEAIGVRTKTESRDVAAVAHRQWMSREQLAAMVQVGQALLSRWTLEDRVDAIESGADL